MMVLKAKVANIARWLSSRNSSRPRQGKGHPPSRKSLRGRLRMVVAFLALGGVTTPGVVHAQQPIWVMVAQWDGPNGAGYNPGKTDTSCSTAWSDASHTAGSWSCKIGTDRVLYTASSATPGGSCQGGIILNNLTVPPWSLPEAGCVAGLTASLSGNIRMDPTNNLWICNAADQGASFVYTDPGGTSLPPMQVSVVVASLSSAATVKATVRGSSDFGQSFTVVGSEDILCRPSYSFMPEVQNGSFDWQGVLTAG